MRLNKSAEGSSQSIQQLVSQVFRPTLDDLYKSIARGALEDMKNGLSKVLGSISGEFLAQLILLDDQDTVTLCVISPPSDVPLYGPKVAKGLKEALIDAELRTLGWKVKRTAFLRRAIQKKYSGKFIACIHLTEEEEKGILRKKEEKGLHYHYYHAYNLNVDGGISLGEKIGKERDTRVPVFFDVGPLAPWINEIVVLGKRWPPHGKLPAMSGILIFTLRPNEQPDTLEKRIKKLEERLKRQEDNLYLASWFMLYSAFIFQTYALSQASAEEPRRLRQELSRLGWSKQLRKVSRDPVKLKERVENMLLLPFGKWQGVTDELEFAKRRVLREFVDKVRFSYPECIDRLCKELVELLRPSRKGNQNRLNYGVLRHLKVLYPNVSDLAVKKKCLEMAWLKVKLLLSECPDPITFSLALSAMEDIYRVCNPTMQVEICDAIVNLVYDSINQKTISRRLVESVLVAMVWKNKGDKEQFQRLVEALVNSLLFVKSNEQNEIAECIKRVFATLEPPDREKIIGEIDRGGEDIVRLFGEELRKTDTNLKKLEVISFLPLDATVDKPKLIPVTVMSQKGGVGKTLIALGLSHILANPPNNKRVCLVELDFFGPTLWYWLNQYGSEKLPKVFLNEYMRRAVDHQAKKGEFLPNSERRVWLQNIKKEIDNLGVIVCAVDRELQRHMLKPALEELVHEYIKDELSRLLKALHDDNYEYVVFDTPAELKEVTASAAFNSLRYKGINIFVSTLFDPAIQPLLGSIPLEFSKGNNYLIFNKLRELDKQYVEDKTACVDLLGTQWSANAACSVVLSENLIEQVLNVKCHWLAWSETLEEFLAVARGPIGDNLWKTIESKEIKAGLQKIAENLLGDETH